MQSKNAWCRSIYSINTSVTLNDSSSVMAHTYFNRRGSHPRGQWADTCVFLTPLNNWIPSVQSDRDEEAVTVERGGRVYAGKSWLMANSILSATPTAVQSVFVRLSANCHRTFCQGYPSNSVHVKLWETFRDCPSTSTEEPWHHFFHYAFCLFFRLLPRCIDLNILSDCFTKAAQCVGLL